MFQLQIVNVEEDFSMVTFGEDYLAHRRKICRYLGRKKGRGVNMRRNMKKTKLNKPWKIYGYMLLALLAALVVFDATVMIVYEIQWDKYVENSREAREAGYPNSYDICSRQGNIVIDGEKYMLFEAHRDAILDGDYNEKLIVSMEDDFVDKYPEKEGNLEIFAKELGFVYDGNQERYTIIDVYMVDLCREGISGDWVWNALGITIITVPILFAAGIVWLIGFVIYKRKGKRLR